MPSGRTPQAYNNNAIWCYRSPGPGRGSGGAEAKEEKVKSCAVAHAPAARILYGRLHRPKTSHFPWLYIPYHGRKASKGKRCGHVPWGRIELSTAARRHVWPVLNWPRCRGLRWTHSAFLRHFHHLFPLDVRKYMLISIYYVDYGIISWQRYFF